MEQSTKDILRITIVRASVFKYGQMVRSMKGNGVTTRPMEKASFGMRMVTYTRETGKMIRQMAMEYIFTSMVLNTKENGRMIYNMAMELNRGLMVLSTPGIMKKG